MRTNDLTGLILLILFLFIMGTPIYFAVKKEDNKTEYKVTDKIEIMYFDNTKDTIVNTVITPNDSRYYIKTSTGNNVTRTEITPTLVCKNNWEKLTSYVKKYRILNSDKEKIGGDYE